MTKKTSKKDSLAKAMKKAQSAQDQSTANQDDQQSAQKTGNSKKVNNDSKPSSSQQRSSTPAPKKSPQQVPEVKHSRKRQTNKSPAQKIIKRFELRLDLNKFLGKGLIYLIIGVILLSMLFQFLGNAGREPVSLSQLITDIRQEKVTKLEVAGDEIYATYPDEHQTVTYKEVGQEVVGILKAAEIDLTQVELEIEDISLKQLARDIISYAVFLGLMLVVFLFLFKGKGGPEGILGIGRSKAKVFIKGKQDVKFADVGGMDEAKKELEEVVDFLKHPKKYRKVGARTPKGVLLVGPSGTGKTLLARAVAGEANVQFLSIAGSEFMEMLVGVGASRVRDLFATAKKMSPAIIFIDEIDAIGRMRGFGSMGGHDEREQTLNQILVEMDGFTPNDNVIVMAATNRGDMLDPALIRPGRFDRRVVVQLPDLKERQYIIKIHAKGKPFAQAVEWQKVAKRTVGFSGADIENMLNEAAIAIARDSRSKITMEDIDEAALKVKLGPSKKRLQDDYERQMTAYHEAGHAVVAHMSAHADPVHRISIVSRGEALGYTFTPPERDKLQVTKSELLDRITVMLGGRAAEQLIFTEQTAGASNDIEHATRLARSMVVEYGMSELGSMNFGPQYDKSRYTKFIGEPYKISDALQQKVDKEINKIIDQCQDQAAKLLKKHRAKLDKVSDRLLKVETLDSDEFEKLMGRDKVKAKRELKNK
ncbi:MAG: ATP-dependent zinc metalloprotease FtsH [Candidatus Pacebacteria bacterium]|nr:ATP-dependent zinc metalloprotease FtsH [Candidatus Paceibacterota bacterium]